MGEPFGGHFISGQEHEVLFYEGHPNQLCLKTLKDRTPLAIKVHETSKDNMTRVTSPEFNLFHMASPELERLIVGHSTGVTTTREPSTINSSDLNVLNLVSPDFEKIFANFHTGEERNYVGDEVRPGTNIGQERKSVEQQQEMYTKTFVEALQRMHEQQVNHREHTNKIKIEQNRRAATRVEDNPQSKFIFDRPEFLDLHAHAKLSENAREQMESRARDLGNGENGTNDLQPNAPTLPLTLPPIDLQVQEIVKRERKKQKNRVAASKCRKKKLEREAQLEVTVQQLRERNIELNALANALRNQVTDLKQRVMEHIACGCHVTLAMAY